MKGDDFAETLVKVNDINRNYIIVKNMYMFRISFLEKRGGLFVENLNEVKPQLQRGIPQKRLI